MHLNDTYGDVHNPISDVATAHNKHTGAQRREHRVVMLQDAVSHVAGNPAACLTAMLSKRFSISYSNIIKRKNIFYNFFSISLVT